MESGPSLWLILLTLGVVALGAAMAYGVALNRTRTRSEKLVTEAATKRHYKKENDGS